MPGHSKTRERKRGRGEKRRILTLAKKEQRRKKKPKLSVSRISRLLIQAFVRAGDMAALLSPDKKVREHAYRVLKVELMRLETATKFQFFVLEDFSVMLFTAGKMDTREVHVYTRMDRGMTRKS